MSLPALFVGFCQKGFVLLVSELAVPHQEGLVLLDFDYQLLLCRLWTVDVFLLATSLPLRFVPVVLVHLLLHIGSVPGCSLLRCADLSLSGSSFILCHRVYKFQCSPKTSKDIKHSFAWSRTISFCSHLLLLLCAICSFFTLHVASKQGSSFLLH